MRSEVDHLQVQMRREMKQLSVEVDNRRDLLRNERDLFESAHKLASCKRWLVQLQSGKYSCATCTTHVSFFKHNQQQASPWILRNGGVRYNCRFSKQVCKHEVSDMHILSLELELERKRNPLEFSLQQQLYESRVINYEIVPHDLRQCHSL